MILCWHEQAWEDYLFFQATDKRLMKRVNDLIKDIQRQPFSGLGKPEPLKFNWAGFWSRRVNEEHRLVYTLKEGRLIIAACRYHY